jgi:hypothetical protein
MLWSDHLRRLPATEETRLVNLLTLGFGQLTLAVRLGTQNALVAAVLGALTAAADLLRGSQRLLAPAGLMEAEPELATPVVSGVRWQPFLVSLAAAEQDALLGGLLRVVEQAQQAGALILADQSLATVTAQLDQLEAGLAGSRQELLTLMLRHQPAADA